MARKFSFIELKNSEVDQLTNFVKVGTHPSREIRRARMLLLNHQGYTTDQIKDILNCSPWTFYNTVKKYKQGGFDYAIKDRPRSGRPPIYCGKERAKVTALACSDAPKGFAKWSARLLANKAVELDYVNNGAICAATVHRILKKNDLKPHLHQMWCIGTINAEFIARMEQVLQLYSLPSDPQQPLVCFDEKSYQLMGDTIAPLPMQPGKPARHSEKYIRKGTHQVFVAYMPRIGKRFVWVNPTRKSVDFAFFFKYFMDHYLPTVCPEFQRIQVVMDNLNTHTTASFYKAFDPQTALALSNKVQFYFTPVNASWLNIAEIEIHAISVQCLHRRMKEQKTVSTEIQALVKQRNDNCIKTNWQFSIPNAREKFQRFYADLN